MSEKFRVMISASEIEAPAIEQTFQSTGVLDIYPSTHYEGGLVRAVYALSGHSNLDEFEDAVQDAVEEMFPDAAVERRVMIAHLKR